MAARLMKAPRGRQRSKTWIEARFEQERLQPYEWSNAPGDYFNWHTHKFVKVLYCLSGSIVFHTRDGDMLVEAGDRLEIDPDTAHAATVGPDGVTCLEAAG
jgi:quercetin dioxygenase-like cupin family protein